MNFSDSQLQQSYDLNLAAAIAIRFRPWDTEQIAEFGKKKLAVGAVRRGWLWTSGR
jgi:hypothetical protein